MWVTILHFATQAQINLSKGSNEEKRAVLVELGSKLYFDGKNMSITAKNEYIPLVDNYKPLKAEYDRIGREDFAPNNAKTEALTSVLSRWHGRKESNLRQRFWRPSFYH